MVSITSAVPAARIGTSDRVRNEHLALRRRRSHAKPPPTRVTRQTAVFRRRVWDLNPWRLAPHTLSKRAHSAALATLRESPAVRDSVEKGSVFPATPVPGCGGRVLCNGRP